MNFIEEMNCFYKQFNLETIENVPQSIIDIYKSIDLVSKHNSINSSYIYSSVISNINVNNPIELLSGYSIDFIISLYHKDPNVFLTRLDKKEINLTSLKNIKYISIVNRLENYLSNFKNYDLVVCQHIIDDIIVDYLFNIDEIDGFYSNLELSPQIWKSIYNNPSMIKKVKIMTSNLFSTIVKNLNSGSKLIIYEYPSSFELITNDYLRIQFKNSILDYILFRLSFFDKAFVKKISLTEIGFSKIIDNNIQFYQIENV